MNKINLSNIVPKTLSIAIDDNPSQATSTLTSNNTNVTNNKKITIGTRAYTFKTALTGAVDEVLIGASADATLTNIKTIIDSGRAAVAASTVLTSDNTKPSANETVVLGAKTYTFKAALTEAYAAGTLTSDNTNIEVGKKVTIGTIVYTFVTAFSLHKPYEVMIGADADASLGNLKAAINYEAGRGVKYSAATPGAHPLVTCGAVGSHAVVVTAKSLGTGGNSIAKAEDSAHLDWDGVGATLTGGANSVANEVVIGADADTSLANLKAAVNGSAGAGTAYSTATVASTEVTAGTLNTTNHTLAIAAKTAGIAGNLLASTETSAHLSFTGATLAGGVDASTANAQVTAGTVNTSNHTLPITAITAGLAGNSIATTTDEVTLSWTGATMANGGSTIGTQEVGGEGGVVRSFTVKIPQLTGTPTTTLNIVTAEGDTIYTSGNLTENTTTRTALEQHLMPTDVIKLITSTKVEETLPIQVYLR